MQEITDSSKDLVSLKQKAMLQPSLLHAPHTLSKHQDLQSGGYQPGPGATLPGSKPDSTFTRYGTWGQLTHLLCFLGCGMGLITALTPRVNEAQVNIKLLQCSTHQASHKRQPLFLSLPSLVPLLLYAYTYLGICTLVHRRLLRTVSH